MKLTVISVIFLLTILNFQVIKSQDIKPEEISMSYTQEVFFEKEFNVKISCNCQNQIYDIKIFVEDNNSKIISSIYDSYWKSGNFYIKNAYPTTNEFRIKIKGNYTEKNEVNLCIRIRKPGKSSFSEKCENINIYPNNEKEKKESSSTANDEWIFLSNAKSNLKVTNYTSKEQNISNIVILLFWLFVLTIIIILAGQKFKSKYSFKHKWKK